MSQILDEFQRIITESSIPAQDQNDILVVLPSLPEEAIGALNKVFLGNPKMVEEFNKSFKAKVRALTNQDDKEWEEILQKERQQLDEIEGEENPEEVNAEAKGDSEENC